MALFGLFGDICAKLGADDGSVSAARALLLSRSDPLGCVQRPISAVMLGLAVAAMGVVLVPALRKKRQEALHDEA